MDWKFFLQILSLIARIFQVSNAFKSGSYLVHVFARKVDPPTGPLGQWLLIHRFLLILLLIGADFSFNFWVASLLNVFGKHND